MTPISIPLYKLGSSYILQKKRKDNLYILDHLADTYKIEGPIFVFAHINIAHPPYVFDENGKPIHPNREFPLDDTDWLVLGRNSPTL